MNKKYVLEATFSNVGNYKNASWIQEYFNFLDIKPKEFDKFKYIVVKGNDILKKIIPYNSDNLDNLDIDYEWYEKNKNEITFIENINIIINFTNTHTRIREYEILKEMSEVNPENKKFYKKYFNIWEK